jgi:hemerythrin-like domain-containing protein
MTLTEQGRPNPRGEAMVAELKWVHDMIRHDLGVIRQMAADTESGRPGSAVWQLKVSCLQHCRFVHSHHTHESMLLFPALRDANPALNPVVDKLEADHAHVSDLLDEVEAASHQLGEAGEHAARERLVKALRTLSEDLLAHLQYEEEHISGTLRSWTRWPGW